MLPLATASARAQGGERGDAPDSQRYSLRAELGAEYDSNAHRAEVVNGVADPPPIGSWLQRFVVAGMLSDLVADHQAVALAATAAAKLFDRADARDESVAIAQSSAAWRIAVGRSAQFTLSGAYYEAFQASGNAAADLGERRDFRSLAPTLQLGLATGASTDLTLSAGYRALVFKPDRDFDFWGPTAGIELRWLRLPEIGADWEATAGAFAEDRRFGGPALVASCIPPSPDGLPCPGPGGRSDQLLMTRLEITRTAGRLLAGAGYGFHYNRSNSFGETVTRHFAIARLAAPLPFQVYVAARADLLLAHYADRLQVSAGSTFTSIEDENRSSARIDLSRDLHDGVRIFARYTFYSNELGDSSGSYRRHTLLLSMTFALEK